MSKILGWVDVLGPRDTAYLVLSRVLDRIPGNTRLSRYHIVTQPVLADRTLPEDVTKGIDVRELLQGDDRLRMPGLSADEIANRFESRGACLAAFKGKDLVGWIWVIRGDYTEPFDKCTFRTTPDSRTAWDLDVYVDPSERIGFTFVRLWDEAMEWMRKRQITCTFSRISAFNSRSAASHKRMGAIRLSSQTFIHIGALQIYWSGYAPRFHVCGESSPGPLIELRAPDG